MNLKGDIIPQKQIEIDRFFVLQGQGHTLLSKKFQMIIKHVIVIQQGWILSQLEITTLVIAIWFVLKLICS